MVSRRDTILTGLAAMGGLIGCPGLNIARAGQGNDLGETLDRIVDEHGDRSDMGGIAFAVDGEFAFERYWGGDADVAWDIRSAGKSVTACLVGIAMEMGAPLSLESTLPELLPAFQARAKEDPRIGRMTLADLLAMKSGFDADGDLPETPGNENLWYDTDDWMAYFLDVPMANEPGQHFAYTSMNTALVGMAVARATGQPLKILFEERLAGPLGFEGHNWRLAPHGDVVPQGNLFVRVRDLLTFGEMVRRGGLHNDQRIVPKSWIDLITAQRTEIASPPYLGYGLQWWRGRSEYGAQSVDYPFSSGNGGQKCFVVPDLKLTCAMTSTAFGQGRGHRRAHRLFNAVISHITG